jgi:hypothetical protein
VALAKELHGQRVSLRKSEPATSGHLCGTAGLLVWDGRIYGLGATDRNQTPLWTLMGKTKTWMEPSPFHPQKNF